MLDHHPHGTLAHFRRKLLSLLLVHGSILSKSGASGKPGAVQASAPARSTMRAKPARVNGAPRSDVNTKGE